MDQHVLNMEYGGYSIASFTLIIDSFDPQIVIDDGRLLYTYYLKNPIIFM
jgi:hypothetical protein